MGDYIERRRISSEQIDDLQRSIDLLGDDTQEARTVVGLDPLVMSDLEKLQKALQESELRLHESELRHQKAELRHQKALHESELRLVDFLLSRNKWNTTMKVWIHQELCGINYFDSQSPGGSSHKYEGYWPRSLKKWEDFRANVRAHVNELESGDGDTKLSRNADDFTSLKQFVKPSHGNITHRFAVILNAFMNYEPFQECVVQLSVSEEGASTQPSTEASAEPTEAIAALGPTQMAESASSDSTEVGAATLRANRMAEQDRKPPDISVQNGEKNYFLVVEVKKPNRIRMEGAIQPDLVSPATDVLKEMIRQVTKYMVRQKVGHAILTSEDLTYFFKIEGHSMFVSDGLVWNSSDIPWLGAIHYILNKAKDIVNFNFSDYGTSGRPPKLKGKRRRKSPLGSGSPTTQQQDDCDVIANCHLQAVGHSLREVNVVDLNLHESDYDRGSSGPVALGKICNQDVIIKISRVEDWRGQRLLHELDVYHSLAQLWGQSIPRLVDYGSTVNGSLVFLATEYIAGCRLDRALISEEVASAARTALGAIHCLGVLHGDLRGGNILVVDKDVRIIDFGLAQYSHDRSNQERELYELEKILQEQMTDK